MRNLFAGLAGFCLCVMAGSAQAADRAIIVLDGSGSMWGQIDGKPKLEIARETLKSVLPTLPGDLELGLMAYGHREKGNCQDIELVVPPAAGSAGAIADAAAGLKFLGKTPLSEAVRQAAEALRYTEDKATVILITDGIETCNADPCALGNELETSGVDFTAHVVGFGLSREEGRQVACLAENTGGRYIQAKDEGELRDALTTTVAAKPAPKEEKADIVLPEATVATASKPTIGATLDVDWTGPGAEGDYIDIVPLDEKRIGNELAYAYVEAGSPLPIRAPGKVGQYSLRYVWEGPDKRHVLATATIDVADSETALVAPATVPIGKAFEVTWKGPGQKGDYIDIVPKAYSEFSGELSYAYVETGNPVSIRAPGKAGDYKLRYVLEAPDGRKLLTEVPLTVVEAQASLAFPPTVMAGTMLDISWTGPAAAGDYIDLVPAGYTDVSGELAYFYVESSSDGETASIKTAGDAGDYLVRYVLEGPDGRRVLAAEPLVLTPAQASITAPEAVEAGTSFGFEWTGPNAGGDYVDLVPRGYAEVSGELAYFYTDASPDGRTGTLTAPEAAGEYDIRYVLEAAGGRKVIARVPLTVQ